MKLTHYNLPPFSLQLWLTSKEAKNIHIELSAHNEFASAYFVDLTWLLSLIFSTRKDLERQVQNKRYIKEKMTWAKKRKKTRAKATGPGHCLIFLSCSLHRGSLSLRDENLKEKKAWWWKLFGETESNGEKNPSTRVMKKKARKCQPRN